MWFLTWITWFHLQVAECVDSEIFAVEPSNSSGKYFDSKQNRTGHDMIDRMNFGREDLIYLFNSFNIFLTLSMFLTFKYNFLPTFGIAFSVINLMLTDWVFMADTV